jgi:predicted GH43/DUF377 family glycosyl hydrolase
MTAPLPTHPPVLRTGVSVVPDPRRVAARLFLPGQESGSAGPSRAAGVVARCAEMSDAEVGRELARVSDGYGGRHRDLDAVLERHFLAIAHRVPEAALLPAARRRLIGSYFTREVAVEAAALFNPSVVAHPTQDVPDGLRFVMSARAVSEGHYSTVTFRSGTFRPQRNGAEVDLDAGSRHVECAVRTDRATPRSRLQRSAAVEGADSETLDFMLPDLPDLVDAAALELAAGALRRARLTLAGVEDTITALERALAASYEVAFEAGSALAERTLFPEIDAESHGVEDARFVRLLDEDEPRYAATYTAYNGSQVSSRRIDTADFRSFLVSPLTGTAAGNKGMALFPRRIGGSYRALSRWDRENNAIARSADGYHWDDATELQAPSEPWELTQLGNCGPPLETDGGWLVLTHGVGPMRGYAIGALLLDLDDPSVVVGRLPEPLLEPEGPEREGYVPNVVYSCGALIHGARLLLPYGCSDARIRFALVDVPTLLDRLLRSPLQTPRTSR